MPSTLSRSEQFRKLEEMRGHCDILIIGGGATGLAAAMDAALRGHKVILVEADDFAAGTSSRSTKLVHGGVRYLKQGRISLVRESLRERGRLLRNAPGIVHKRAFVVPCRSPLDKPYYAMGLASYDLLAGSYGWGNTRLLSKAETLEALPGLDEKGLLGGVSYCDGQFDDSRLALALARTAVAAGGVVVNHARAKALIHENGQVGGAIVEARQVGPDGSIEVRTLEIRARVVISAVGVFSDELARMDEPGSGGYVTASQGAHIVLDRSFFPSDTALMVPKTDDGRVLFLIPWEGSVLVGTTDTPVKTIEAEPKPLKDEIDYLLDYTGRYLVRKPNAGDIKSRFAGLRPLVKPSGRFASTAAVSRDHQIFVSDTGLITILGGKWTTCRKMGEDAVNKAQSVGSLHERPCTTAEFPLDEGADGPGYFRSVERSSKVLIDQPFLTEAMVRRMAREEMAETVADVLARRIRALFLDARAARDAAGEVARILAEEKGWSAPVHESQKADFERLALGYLEPA